MIDVFSWATPNGHKVHIMLEECGLAYRAIPVDIGAGDQFKPEFLAISPNNKIPAITDPQGPDGKPISLFESGAILRVPGREDGALPACDRSREVRSAAVAHVPDGQRGADARPGAPLPHVRAAKARLRDRPLFERGEAAVRRHRQAPVAQRMAGRRRILDRRHRHIPVAAQLGKAGHRAGRLSRTCTHGSTASRSAPPSSAACRCSPDLRKPITGDKEREILFGKTQYQQR